MGNMGSYRNYSYSGNRSYSDGIEAMKTISNCCGAQVRIISKGNFTCRKCKEPCEIAVEEDMDVVELMGRE